MTIEQYMTHTEQYSGYCSSCDAITADSGVEPDAEGYKCEECGENTVCGVEQAVLKGLIQLED